MTTRPVGRFVPAATAAAADIVPDGEPGTAFFVVERPEPARCPLLHSTSHLPRALRERDLRP
jgi:hypothetical protein